MTHRLVFVCEANVCRSPLMELVLRAHTDDAHWHVSSAGAHAAPRGSRMCALSATAAAVAGDAATPDLVDAHRATPLTAERVRAADLVLTATRVERAAVATMVPDARARAFTLREAVHLGAEPMDLAAPVRHAPDDEADGLARYAAALHARRGLAAAPHRGRGLLGRRRPHPFDTPDAHHGSVRGHRAMLAATADDVQRFLRQASDFLASPAARGQ